MTRHILLKVTGYGSPECARVMSSTYKAKAQIVNPELPTWVNRHIDIHVNSQRSRYTTKHYCVYPHVALLFRGRKLIAVGQNRVGRRGPYNMIHAEADVVRRAGTSQLRDAVLVVIRLGPVSLLNSKPCPACEQLMGKCMRVHGLRTYLYS